MKTKTIKTRLTAGLISLVMIFSLFATSAGAALAQTIQTPNTLTQQSGVVTEENNLNTPTEPQGTEAKTESGTATTENKTTENEQPAVVDGDQTQNNEAAAASAAQLDNNAITANAPTAAVASTQAAVDNKITFKVYGGPYGWHLFDFEVNLIDSDRNPIILTSLSEKSRTYNIYTSDSNAGFIGGPGTPRWLDYDVSVDTMIEAISGITKELEEREKSKLFFSKAELETFLPNGKRDELFDFYRIGYRRGDNVYSYVHTPVNENYGPGIAKYPFTGPTGVSNNFVFAKPLNIVEGLDSADKGVQIQMFDYDYSTPNYESWGSNGQLYQGLVKRNLENVDVDGDSKPDGEFLPIKKSDSKALDDSFSTKKTQNTNGTVTSNYKGTANGLFVKNIYDNGKKTNTSDIPAGTFYYSSFENYAYWNQPSTNAGTGNFELYKEIGTPKNEGGIDFQRGNFMPYNPIKPGIHAPISNKYDENGQLLQPGSEGYGAQLYKTQAPKKPNGPLEDGNNYYFGMVVSADFVQMKEGKLSNQDMVYEFNGDDDLWVYIDNVLVLDLGGVRGAQSGSINFSTGIVNWRDSSDNSGIRGNTTIKDQFKEAAAEAKEPFNEADSNWNENTFSDFSSHEIKIFYMERGAGASDCKMKFNLPVLPKGSVTVRKEVENINEGSYSDVDFNFKLFLQSAVNPETVSNNPDYIVKEGVAYEVQKNRTYTPQKNDIDGTETKTGSDGSFTLRHGQQALFKDLAESSQKYIIQETGVGTTEYDDFKVDGKPVNEGGGSVISDSSGNSIVQSKALEVGKDNFINFINTCTGTNQHTINIKKVMETGQTSEDLFTFMVNVGGQAFTGEYTVLDKNGQLSGSQKCADGKITIKADQTIKIDKIAAGTSFNVEEIELDANKYDTPTYTMDIQATPTQVGIGGIIPENPKAINVTVKNTKKVSGLTIEKTIDDVKYIDGDPIFTFKITEVDKDGNPLYVAGSQQLKTELYRTLRLSEAVGKTAKITIENLPVGYYKVEELNTMRYTCMSTNPQIVDMTVNQNNQQNAQTVKFENNLTSKGKYSHTDVVENSFKVDKATGNIDWKKNDVPQGQTPNGEQNTQQPQQ